MIIVKQVNPAYGVIGEKMTFILEVTNNDLFTINNVMVNDVLADQFVYVAESLKVNGSKRAGSPEIGVSLGDMIPLSTQQVQFDVNVVGKGTGTVENIAAGSYLYFNPSTGLQEFVQLESLPVVINILDPEVEVTKYQDRDSATVGDVVNYTINIYNSGDLDLFNLKIIDVLSKAFELVSSSVMVNGKLNSNYDLSTGIIIPTLKQGETVIVTFAVIVKGCSCKSCIANSARVEANYLLPNGTLGVEVLESNSTSLFIGLSCFKQLLLNKSLRLPECKPEIEEVNDLSATIKIEDAYTINTVQGESVEGQILTGQKLVVNGILKVMLSYTALNVVQSVYVVEYEIPFGNYLVTPLACTTADSFDATGIIEDISYTLTGTRELTISASILVRANAS